MNKHYARIFIATLSHFAKTKFTLLPLFLQKSFRSCTTLPYLIQLHVMVIFQLILIILIYNTILVTLKNPLATTRTLKKTETSFVVSFCKCDIYIYDFLFTNFLNALRNKLSDIN